MGRVRLGVVCVALSLCVAPAVPAQETQPETQPPHDHAAMTGAASGWSWSTDGNAFFGYNYQRRQFLDYRSWESQNWFMATVERPLGRGRLTLDGMVTFEPFTLPAQGSPQLFQTGETYRQVPLVNYQHPHDLVMGLRATYRVNAGRVGLTFGADPVGEPTLGPTAFMHRESARSNPQVPLTHHYLDSTHVTPGVLRAGVTAGAFTFESSVFRGAEPDENRVGIERPRLDSWAARVQYRRGPWQAQFSGGRLQQPEPFEPFDVHRFTASLAFDGAVAGRPLRMLAAWGRNEAIGAVNGIGDGGLLEGDLTLGSDSTVYGRLEIAEKEVLGLEVYVPGVPLHPHFFYRVDVGTVGYLHRLVASSVGTVSVGADVTLYGMPPVLAQFWGSSSSFHVFMRWRPATGMTHQH